MRTNSVSGAWNSTPFVAAAHVYAESDEIHLGKLIVGEQVQRHLRPVVLYVCEFIQPVGAFFIPEREPPGVLNIGTVEIQRAERRGAAEADITHNALPVRESHDR